MHLSLLSDATFSDLLDDSGWHARSSCEGIGRQHFDGLLRGLVFASALMLPVALTFLSMTQSSTHASSTGFEARP